jgi:hypothetical protein
MFSAVSKLGVAVELKKKLLAALESLAEIVAKDLEEVRRAEKLEQLASVAKVLAEELRLVSEELEKLVEEVRKHSCKRS